MHPHPITTSQTQTHASLLARLNAAPGDQAPEAWREFLERYGDLIRGFCRTRALAAADTDDILQDVLLNLTRAMPGFEYDPAKGKFRSYLKTVTLHAIFKRSRQARGETPLGDHEHTSGAHTQHHPAAGDSALEDQWETQWRRYHLRRGMNRLEAEFSARDREAFERYAILGEDAQRVASDLQLTIDNLYKVKSRLTNRLAALIAEQIDDEG